jgi:hypothetical protein
MSIVAIWIAVCFRVQAREIDKDRLPFKTADHRADCAYRKNKGENGQLHDRVPEPLDLQESGRVLVWYIGHGFNENAANAALERMTGKLVARRIQRHKKVRFASL